MPILHQCRTFVTSKGVKEIKKSASICSLSSVLEMMQKTGRRTVPQIYIGDQHIGGFDDLRALDLAGGLDHCWRKY